VSIDRRRENMSKQVSLTPQTVLWREALLGNKEAGPRLFIFFKKMEK
jgi:hypothetical protein